MIQKKSKFKTIELSKESIVVHPDHSNVSVLVLDEKIAKTVPGDSSKHPMRSKVSLVVNGEDMTDPHTMHDEIPSKVGSFSHWDNYIIFHPRVPQASIETIAIKIPRGLFK